MLKFNPKAKIDVIDLTEVEGAERIEESLIKVPTGTVQIGNDYTIGEFKVWSVGVKKNSEDKSEYASTGTEFYENPEYKCIWLR